MSLDSFSPRINLEQSRKQAKDLVKAFQAGERRAIDVIRSHHPRFKGLDVAHATERPFRLADAQLVVARIHYFESWPKLLQHIDTLERQDPRVARFEDAANAIIAGDIETLRTLVRVDPNIVHERSTRAHRAPLLHYISANGVEDYRQVTPPNAIAVARLLLDSGAEVDATSEAYGGDSTALGLVATSTPPRRAGVQIPLIDLLLERGAAIDGVRSGQSFVRDALANDCPEAARALAERGARIPGITAAAGIGRLDLVVQLAEDASERDLGKALIAAAGTSDGHDIVRFLLDRGVDVAAATGWTALHAATGGANPRTIDLLIRRGAPLETKNMYGGTVLGQAIWFAFHGDPARTKEHARVIDELIAAGARTDAYAEMERHIEEIRRRAGAA